MTNAKPSQAPWFYIAMAMGLGMFLSCKPVVFFAFLTFFLSIIIIISKTPDFLIFALFATIGFIRGLPQKKTRIILSELDNKPICSTFRIYNECKLKLCGTSVEMRSSMPGFKQGTLLRVEGVYKSDFNMLIPSRVDVIGNSKKLFDKIHNYLSFQIMQTFGLYQEGILIKALLTGDRKGLSKESVEKFRKAGVAHLLAISGLHIGFLFLLFNTIFMFIFRNDVISKILSSIIGGFYTFSLGPLAPCLRAFWFLLLLNLSNLIGKKVRSLNIWGITFSLSIFLKPQWLRDPSFLMSYFAILGYLTLSEIFAIKFQKQEWTGKIEGYFLLVLVPLLFTLPLQSLFFKRVSLISFVSNIFLVPIAFLIIFESSFALIFHSSGLPLWVPFRNCALFLSRLMLDLSDLLGKLPGNSLSAGTPPFFFVFSLLYIILIIYVLHKLRRKGG